MKAYSKRTLKFINSPKYVLQGSEQLRLGEKGQKTQKTSVSLRDFFSTAIELTPTEWLEITAHVDTEGHLADAYYQTNCMGLKLGLLEGFFHLLQGKSRRQILALTMREVESFMRDENHVPAYPVTSEVTLDLSLVINVIIKEINKSLGSSAIDLAARENFQTLPLVVKIKAVEALFDRAIRPALVLDGGDLLLVNILQDQIYLSFQGNCSACPSATGGTFDFVVEIIKKHLGESFTVQVVPAI